MPMKDIVFLIEEAFEGGYTARTVGESIFTEAATVPELCAAARDALRCHFETEESRPRGIRFRRVAARHQ